MNERERERLQSIVEVCERASGIASRAPAALEALERIADALDADDCATPPSFAGRVVNALERIAESVDRDKFRPVPCPKCRAPLVACNLGCKPGPHCECPNCCTTFDSSEAP